MNMRTIGIAVVILLTATISLAADDGMQSASGDSGPDESTAATATIVLAVEGLQSTEGQVYASLFLSADGFPDVLDKAFANLTMPATQAEDGRLTLTFADIPAGTVGISLFHDANSNRKLDTNFLGIPKEQYGFSQNPPSPFGPPSFDKTAVNPGAGETLELVITLK